MSQTCHEETHAPQQLGGVEYLLQRRLQGVSTFGFLLFVADEKTSHLLDLVASTRIARERSWRARDKPYESTAACRRITRDRAAYFRLNTSVHHAC
jgi:hypothetical protein